MKSFYSLASAIILTLVALVPGTMEANNYYYPPVYQNTNNQSYRAVTKVVRQTPRYNRTPNLVTCTDLSNTNVGVGTLGNGVVVTIDSTDRILQDCIKRTYWLPYFTRFGDTVIVSVSNTTFGIQVTATSNDAFTIGNLQNASWKTLLTGNVNARTYDMSYNDPYYNANYNYGYYTPTYTPTYTPPTPQYIPPTFVNTSNCNINTCTPQNCWNNNCSTQNCWNNVCNQNNCIVNNCNNQNCWNNNCITSIYDPNRVYTRGSAVIANTNNMIRQMSYLTNGVKMSFVSPDFNTTRYLQNYSFTGFFSYMSGISISLVNISGGIEVTVTAGSNATIEEIKRVGYALVYQ